MIDKTQIPIEDYVMSNKGYIKLNGVEILELKECHIKSTPNTKKLNAMNISSELERKTSYSNEIQFKINKVYTRFKRTLLNNAKKFAACPEDVSIPAVPPSSSAILAAT